MKQILTDEEREDNNGKIFDELEKVRPIISLVLGTNNKLTMYGGDNVWNAMLRLSKLTEQAIIKKIEKEIDRKKQWHKGECRGFPDCSICLFLKELQSLFKNNKEMM